MHIRFARRFWNTIGWGCDIDLEGLNQIFSIECETKRILKISFAKPSPFRYLLLVKKASGPRNSNFLGDILLVITISGQKEHSIAYPSLSVSKFRK